MALLVAGLMVCTSLSIAEQKDKPKETKPAYVEVRLTDNTVIDSDPVFSPDMTKVVFVSVSNQEGRSSLHIMDADGKNRKVLLDQPGEAHASPQFLPDGKTVLFVYNAGAGSDFATLDISTGARKNLTSLRGKVFWPAIEPGGKSFVFVQLQATTQGLWKCNIEDGTISPFLTGPRSCDQPTYSPDGKFVYYCEFDDVGTNLCRVDADGKNRKVLFSYDPEEGGDSILPNVLKDGRVVFQTSVKLEYSNIFVMDADGKNARKLFDAGFPAMWPTVTPDGARVVFIGNMDIKKWELYLYTASDGKLTRLTDNRFEERRVRFSPDGKWVLYVSDVVGNPEIFKMQIVK